MEINVFTKKNRRQCPLPIIEQASSEGWMISLAVFMRIKRFISHGHFKSIEEGSTLTGIPKSTLHRHIRKLKKKGLIYKSHKRYRILSTKQLRKMAKTASLCTVFIDKEDSLLDTKYNLYNKIKENFAQQQEFNIQNAKLAEGNTPSKKQIKRFKEVYCCSSYDEAKERRDKRYKDRKYLLNGVGFTYEWLANELNISKAQAYNLTKWSIQRDMCSTSVKMQQITDTYTKPESIKVVEKELLKYYTHCFNIDGFFFKNDLSIHNHNKYWGSAKSVLQV